MSRRSVATVRTDVVCHTIVTLLQSFFGVIFLKNGLPTIAQSDGKEKFVTGFLPRAYGVRAEVHVNAAPHWLSSAQSKKITYCCSTRVMCVLVVCHVVLLL